jgi:hypothetical protein
MNSSDFDPVDCAATAHPGSKGSQDRSTTGPRPGVEDENRRSPITAQTYSLSQFPAVDEDRGCSCEIVHRVGIRWHGPVSRA